MLSINRKMNIVVPIEREDGSKIYIHSTPISTPTFEKYFLVLAKTFSAFAENGVVVTSAPSIARLTLKQVAESTPRTGDSSWWVGDDGVGGSGGLIEDIVRMSNVINGEEIRPLKDHLISGSFTEEDKNEVLSLLIFFIVVSHIPPRLDRADLLRGMASIYHLGLTYSTPTDYANSLKTSTSAANTGENPPT